MEIAFVSFILLSVCSCYGMSGYCLFGRTVPLVYALTRAGWATPEEHDRAQRLSPWLKLIIIIIIIIIIIKALRIVAALLSCYLQEQWTLVLGLGVRSPEPVGQPSSLGGGDVVAQGQGLLLQLLSGVVPGQQAVPLALPPQPETDNIMNRGYTN